MKLPDLDALIPFGIYEEFLKPYYKRMVDKIKGFGKKVEFHMCGKVEPFIMDLAEMGVPVVSAFILDGINDQDAFALSASPLSLNYAQLKINRTWVKVAVFGRGQHAARRIGACPSFRARSAGFVVRNLKDQRYDM